MMQPYGPAVVELTIRPSTIKRPVEPQVTIDGVSYQGGIGTHVYQLAPGTHVVEVWQPHRDTRRQVARGQLTVGPGQMAALTYQQSLAIWGGGLIRAGRGVAWHTTGGGNGVAAIFLMLALMVTMFSMLMTAILAARSMSGR
jgi:hypothetical protein